MKMRKVFKVCSKVFWSLLWILLWTGVCYGVFGKALGKSKEYCHRCWCRSGEIDVLPDAETIKCWCVYRVFETKEFFTFHSSSKCKEKACDGADWSYQSTVSPLKCAYHSNKIQTKSERMSSVGESQREWNRIETLHRGIVEWNRIEELHIGIA